MESPYLNSGEAIVLTTNRVSADAVSYDIMLTSERLFLIDNRSARFEPRIIPLSSILSVQGGKTPAHDPGITLLFRTGGETGARQPLNLIFYQSPGENRRPERDIWVRNLIQLCITAHEKTVTAEQPAAPEPSGETGLRPMVRHGTEKVRPLSHGIEYRTAPVPVTVLPDDVEGSGEIPLREAVVPPEEEENRAPAEAGAMDLTPVRGIPHQQPSPLPRVVIPQIFDDLLPARITEAPPVHMILVVDDSPFNVDVFVTMLERGGYRTVSAHSGEECLEILRNVTPDLILLDIMMEQMDGWQTLEHIRANKATKEIPVLMLTAKQLNPAETQVHGLSLDDYIPKPITHRELYDAIERAFSRHRSIIAPDSVRQPGIDGEVIRRLSDEEMDHHPVREQVPGQAAETDNETLPPSTQVDWSETAKDEPVPESRVPVTDTAPEVTAGENITDLAATAQPTADVTSPEPESAMSEPVVETVPEPESAGPEPVIMEPGSESAVPEPVVETVPESESAGPEPVIMEPGSESAVPEPVVETGPEPEPAVPEPVVETESEPEPAVPEPIVETESEPEPAVPEPIVETVPEPEPAVPEPVVETVPEPESAGPEPIVETGPEPEPVPGSPEPAISEIPESHAILTPPENVVQESASQPPPEVALPQEPGTTESLPERHPAPPAEEIRPPGGRIAYAVVLLLVIALAAAGVILLLPHGPGGADFPVTPTPGTGPGTMTSPEPGVPVTVSPALQITTPVPPLPVPPAPRTGVWVRVNSTARYLGASGNAGQMQPLSGIGDNFYRVPAGDRPVQVSVQKQDNSGARLEVGIYRDGTLISSRSVTSPMGAVNLLIDPVTGRPPGLTVNDTPVPAPTTYLLENL